jgi:putative peptidoglycan lipid II flippase
MRSQQSQLLWLGGTILTAITRPRIGAPSALTQALGLFFVSSLVRGLGALAALALAAYVGAGADMDRYMAFSMVLSTACALFASPLPVVVTRRIAQGPDLSSAAHTCRQWARMIQRKAVLAYALACPVLAWLFTPKGTPGFTELLALLFLGLPSVLVCAVLATEQALLQARGHPFQAMWSAALTSGTSLGTAAVCGHFGGVYLAAFGLAVGPCLEFLWIRRLNSAISTAQEDSAVEAFPWATMLTVLGASAGILVQSFYDQSLLAHMGAGAQATWGLATRAPSFFNMSLAGMAGVVWSGILCPAHAEGRVAAQSFRLCGLVLCLTIVVMGLVGVMAEPLVRVLYERGAFGPDDTTKVAHVLHWAVIAYVTYPASTVLIRALGLIGGHKTLVASSVVFLIVKVSVTTALLPWLGVGGLTVATLAGGGSQMAMLGWRIRQSTNSKK